MKAIRILLIVCCLSVLAIPSRAQEPTKSLMVMNMSAEETFRNLKRFALDNDYFILQMDQTSGIMQLKYKTRPKGILSWGRILTINILLEQEKSNDTRIDLQINEHVINSTTERYYLEDEGMAKNPNYYTDFVRLLKTFFDRIQS